MNVGKSQVRSVAESVPGSTNVQGSPTSSVGGFSSSSYAPGPQQLPLSSASTTQNKRSRIQEINEDVEKHDDLVFDIRSSSPCSFSGGVHVVYHYIGDSDGECGFDECFNGVIRTVVCGDDDSSEQLHSILIDRRRCLNFPNFTFGGRKAVEC